MYKNDRDWMQRFEELLGQAKRYVKFCASIFEHQRAHGRYFLHEHPWLATSRQMEVMTKLDGYPDVRKVLTHMCQFGMVSRTGKLGSALASIEAHRIFHELPRHRARTRQEMPTRS